MYKKLTIEKFKLISSERHNNKYDYSQTELQKDNKIKVKIIMIVIIKFNIYISFFFNSVFSKFFSGVPYNIENKNLLKLIVPNKFIIKIINNI